MIQNTSNYVRNNQIKILTISTIISILSGISIVTLNLLIIIDKFEDVYNRGFVISCIRETEICSDINYKISENKTVKWFHLRKLGNYDEFSRASMIVEKLERYRLEKIVRFENSYEGNHQIICVHTKKKPKECQNLFTVPPTEIDSIERNLRILRCKNRDINNIHCADIYVET